MLKNIYFFSNIFKILSDPKVIIVHYYLWPTTIYFVLSYLFLLTSMALPYIIIYFDIRFIYFFADTTSGIYVNYYLPMIMYTLHL